MNKSKIKFYISGIAVIMIVSFILIYLNFYRDNDEPFLSNDWASVSDPVFYHHFSKTNDGYTLELYDKTGDFASKRVHGKLTRTTLTFAGTNYLENVYIYKNGLIYVKNIGRNGVIDYFAPLKKVNHEYKK